MYFGFRLIPNMLHNLLMYTNNFYFGYIAVSCFFETFPGVAGWLAVWLENPILMKTQSSVWTWTLGLSTKVKENIEPKLMVIIGLQSKLGLGPDTNPVSVQLPKNALRGCHYSDLCFKTSVKKPTRSLSSDKSFPFLNLA